ncbi:signaling lymphocytic activation molecule-like [Mobula hypostoma]|uniref:signaling lymphocytic activation molecule-like n=1 Tax=Mobula hypostoma TaxID=723540 RepID=UPI002FC330A8
MLELPCCGDVDTNTLGLKTLMVCLSVLVLAETDGNPTALRVVNGTLGQSVTLPGYVPGENTSVITWDYTNLSNQKTFPLCEKYKNSPTDCTRERITLNLKDNSLEIQNLTDSDEGLYEIYARTNKGVHKEMTELRIYESISAPVISISKLISHEVCNISLHCLVERGTEPVYTWWTGDDDITANESHVLIDGGRSLELSVRLSDNNTVYNCTVRNPVSEATMSVDLRNLCQDTEGEKLLRPLHIGLIIAAVLIFFLVAILFMLYWNREPKVNEAANTEGRSESVLYAVIRRANLARDQPQGHLHQLDANEGHQNPRAQLTTIYDEIKYNPDLNTLLAATSMDQKFNTES